MQSALPLGPREPADPMALEVSLAVRGAVWSLWQAPIGESQQWPLGFWRKALSSSTDNHSPFGKQVLNCVLVCLFHTATKIIPKTGSFIKERGLIDSQFCMAGEASGNLQSRWKGK